MPKTRIAGIGMYVPKNIVTNADLMRYMDTTDEWIQQRTGIKERRYADRIGETTTTMGAEAAKMAIENAGITKDEVDFVVFATLSPDYTFPGCGVLLQRAMGLKNIGALDVRNQCSGFIYALSVADQFIRSGMYKNILVVGAEKHSFALDFSTRGRSVSVMFGDGAGAVVVQPTEKENDGILSTHLHCDGNGAEVLACYNPGTHANHWAKETAATYPEQDWFGNQYITQEMIENAQIYPNMDGHAVMKRAITFLPDVINEALTANNYTIDDLNMLILNQSNARIAEFVQQKLGLTDDEIYINIYRYGNTTAASIPIAMYEAVKDGKLKSGDLLCLGAYGSGFTWASALIRF
ncbi:ketoacyl-ACP synthase III [Panacibacter ginsenosidivorans]|uniref:Beta-ketoacyl-[acyl-carrier-protein] synthase III n=1 Tax=Panacibacter ginsenosidivorans TaxID=1813871 RepID=A0A5B8V936_9BACT|nr:beta-ketoacyl-ACP synthase III [Panacibacter ginsenosidivorans]QEC67862.1 ketoacyl-ACP synthase III [Panacibacter ginsenosidivorans]